MPGMELIRSFIAINLSPQVEQALERVIRQLRATLPKSPVRWVPAKNIHLTLKFLGDLSPSNLEALKEVIKNEAGRHLPFQVSVAEIGGFPSIYRPRVIWMGVQAPPDLSALQRGIETETAKLGYPPEERPFSPHLTLGRIGKNARPEETRRIGEALSDAQVGSLGQTEVSEVQLYRSDLQPGGAVYTQMFTAPLGQY